MVGRQEQALRGNRRDIYIPKAKMLTSAPHLYIRRPSPTTAEFTVTTCPRLTLPLRIALLGLLLLRIVTIFLVLLALYTQYGAAITTLSYPYPHFGSSPSASSSPTATVSGRVGIAEPRTATSGRGRKWATSLKRTNSDPYVTIPEPIQLVLLTLASTSLGQSVDGVVSMLPTWAFLAISASLLYIALFRRIHTTESVLVLRGLGIQTSSSSEGGIWGLNYISRLIGFGNGHGHPNNSSMPACLAIGNGGGVGNKTRFIPTAQIQDVLINEAFRGFEVRYYLVVIVQGEEDVVVLFPGLLPNKRIVETVWREVKACLYEQADGTSWQKRGSITHSQVQGGVGEGWNTGPRASFEKG
ncbi:phosphatidylinositol N-acetylglucosaminyltransferase [Rhypophila decipiens]|uniref:Phosphatidylinositol N-acetylglucosaminyltransferase n=1 Tax=Rhypophila decipiens TaxID=261697 RepID=A0AAN7B7F7_9PEZI|nr:phosphatidylinositol N-acetylglucosaminyltransferase [Rhypophila decipiens]